MRNSLKWHKSGYRKKVVVSVDIELYYGECFGVFPSLYGRDIDAIICDPPPPHMVLQIIHGISH